MNSVNISLGSARELLHPWLGPPPSVPQQPRSRLPLHHPPSAHPVHHPRDLAAGAPAHCGGGLSGGENVRSRSRHQVHVRLEQAQHLQAEGVWAHHRQR